MFEECNIAVYNTPYRKRMVFQNAPSETQKVLVCIKPCIGLESERQNSIKHVKLAGSLSPHCEKRAVFLLTFNCIDVSF